MGNDQELGSQGDMEGLIMKFSTTNIFGQKIPSVEKLETPPIPKHKAKEIEHL